MRAYRRTPPTTLIPFIQMLSLVLVFALPILWGSRVYTSSPAHYQKITVKPGDTVWSIVERRTAPGDDVGEAVYRVMAINHMKPDSGLKPGQTLLLPTR